MHISQDLIFWRRPLDWKMSPEEVLGLVRNDPYPFALIGAWAGGGAIIGSEPVCVRCPPTSLADVLGVSHPLRRSPPSESAAYYQADPRSPASRTFGNAFGGGWVGYIGYGTSNSLQRIPPGPGDPRELPDWWFGFYDHVIHKEAESGCWFFEALLAPGRDDALEQKFRELRRRATAVHQRTHDFSCGRFLAIPAPAAHKDAIRQTIELIRQGDIFQANICLRLEAEFSGDPLDLFCRGYSRLQPPYAAYIQVSGSAVASFSPELFIRRVGREVHAKPIKGTSRRSGVAAEAEVQRAWLENSGKDRAENVMIVDLMRNDLSRVCVPGSVLTPGLVQVEAHPGVWHLVSTVRGTLRDECGDTDLIQATFPPGSVTGAPKVRATEIIHELESTKREIYTGTVGYLSPMAGLELNVAIRTFEFHKKRVWLGVGGGIVADSDVENEWLECLIKARPLIEAVGSAIDERHGLVMPHPRASELSLRPRPAAGVFTSASVLDGNALALALHIARLDESSRSLFSRPLPESIADQVRAHIGQMPAGRLRIQVKPLGGQLRTRVEIVPLEGTPDTTSLRTATVAGGLGPHKWTDRRLLAVLGQQAGLLGDEQLLLQDAYGQVLETDRGNIFAVIGGVLRTPPADGRILPGVTRALILSMGSDGAFDVQAGPIEHRALLSASEIFVTNAVRGVIPVRMIDGSKVGSDVLPLTTLVKERITRLRHEKPCGDSGYRGRVSARSDGGNTPRRRRRSVIVIDNYDSFTYNLVHMLRACDCEVEVVRNDEVSAEQVTSSGARGILISPGPCAPAEAGVSIETVRNCGSTPVLGVCLGHQVIAAALGGGIVRAVVPVHGKTSAITHDGKGVLSGLPPRFEATRYHSLVVEEASLPGCLEVSARTDDGVIMAIRHSSRPVEGVQFHPESILTSGGQVIIENFIRMLEADRNGDGAT